MMNIAGVHAMKRDENDPVAIILATYPAIEVLDYLFYKNYSATEVYMKFPDLHRPNIQYILRRFTKLQLVKHEQKRIGFRPKYTITERGKEIMVSIKMLNQHLQQTDQYNLILASKFIFENKNYDMSKLWK